ncbi:MAG: hypothetical protein SGI89_06805 [bacterium]|nr:hypothetical protein [bacterium]
MKRIKIPVKKKRTNKENYGQYIFESQYKPNKAVKIIFYALIILLPLLLTYIFYRFALRTNGVSSFPLDDPWIHLTFAKNLAQYFSFSYFKTEMVTAGSTSPLYTIILSVFFLIYNNEMIISYFLGVLFFVLASVSFYNLCKYEFDKEIIFALLCTGIFIIDKWMNFIALSGMETTMFIFILILCAYFYRTRKAIPLAIGLGLLMWTRPDSVAFIAAVLIDYLLVRAYSRDNLRLILFTDKELKQIALTFILITGLYFLFNFILSGSILPNTYQAKLTYYAPEFRSRYDFLKFEVWDYFKYAHYYVIMIGFLFSLGKLIYDLINKNYNQNTIYIVFILALVLIYWLKLPYAHRFGRYLMPIIPFFILVGTIGFRDMARIINKYTTNALFAKSVFYILIGITYFMGIKIYDETRELYSQQCRYIYDRQVKAAQWIKKNTKEGDIIATHDVGAIGFYSDRKIVDVAGLVTPELITKINDQNYVEYMTQYLREKGVTHLAFLREWYRVSNQNPMFSTIALPPEVMEVYKFDPEKTHILSREANSLVMNAQTLAGQKAAQQINYILNRVLELEPESSYAYYLRAYANSLLKDDVGYEKNMLKAIELFPDFKDAHLYLGIFYNERKRFEEARPHMERVIQIEPNNMQAANLLQSITDSINAQQLSSENPLK